MCGNTGPPPKALEALILSGYDCGYHTFDNPGRLLEALKVEYSKPDLLIASLKDQASSINGVQLLQQCKQVHPKLKVGLTSLYFSTRDLLAIKRSPVKPDGLVTLLYGEPEPFQTLEKVLHTSQRRPVSERLDLSAVDERAACPEQATSVRTRPRARL